MLGLIWKKLNQLIIYTKSGQNPDSPQKNLCGQTDTKILPTEKVETGLKKKERRRRRKKKSRNIMSPTFIGLGDIKIGNMCYFIYTEMINAWGFV